jgi:hypothetical protein
MKKSIFMDWSKGVLLGAMFLPFIAHASVESSLMGLKTVLISGILPILAVMAMGLAAFQFFTGNPNAKTNLWYAVIGAVILFGAQSIIDLISRTVK